jgi:hypothetical protein
VTAFIVERAFGGVTNGPPEKKMGIKVNIAYVGAVVSMQNMSIPLTYSPGSSTCTAQNKQITSFIGIIFQDKKTKRCIWRK